MSAIQLISRHAAPLICHLGGGLSHLAPERGLQRIQITAVNSLAQIGSSSRDYWCAVRSWFWFPPFLWDYKTHNSSRRQRYGDVHFWGIDAHSAFAIKPWHLAYLIFTQGKAPNDGSAMDVHMEDSTWKTAHEGNFKGFSWIICIFFCFMWGRSVA